jgi:hypothetical protein
MCKQCCQSLENTTDASCVGLRIVKFKCNNWHNFNLLALFSLVPQAFTHPPSCLKPTIVYVIKERSVSGS